MPDLSILIPARKEMWLAQTIKDILKNIEGDTEIIVVLDGEWSNPAIDDDPRVKLVYLPESIGQRAATNLAAKLSKAKYVMKVDAHCAFDKGFDRKLMEDMQDDWTVVPIMNNLWAWDWKCPKCGSRWYQSPSPDRCMRNIRHPGDGLEVNPDCDNTEGFKRKLVWKQNPRRPQNTSYCFDPEPHFQYFHGYKSKQVGDLVETMSLQGSCFMVTRQKYWELNLCDEAFGSWGSQGIEVACKTWLSGGKVICNKKTWYAHMFRTQGGDFGFPYHQKQEKIDQAKEYARDLFFRNRWHLAKYPLSWLVEKFYPVHGWTDKDLENLKRMEEVSKGMLYYTDNQLNVKTAKTVQKQLQRIGLPLLSVSLKPMPNFGDNISVKAKRGYETMFKQIIMGLEAMKQNIVYFCEHDVLYHPSHFDFIPSDPHKFYYNRNWWRIREDGFAVRWDANQVSGLVCYREHALQWYKEKLAEIQKNGFNRSYEPGGRDPKQYEVFMSKYPNIDIRHKGTLTKSKWKPTDFRDPSTGQNWQESDVDHIPGWDSKQLTKLYGIR